MTINPSQMQSASTAPVTRHGKPRLLFFRGQHNLPQFMRSHDSLPPFIRSHLLQHIKCLSTFFDVCIISRDGDYAEICDLYKPDITLVESGVYGGPPIISNTSACPGVPKIGFLNADAYCFSRSAFLSQMERWGIDTYFTISVSMLEYMPSVADKLFVWPNFVDPDIFRDYGQPKTVPVLITGSHAMHYPWRNRISRAIAQHFPSLTCPHLGWFDARSTSRMLYDEQYARMINSSYVVPTCGTIAKEVVRKHFEIPGCNSCLITERTAALEAAGFADMQNCIFATEADVLDKLDYLFENRDVLASISRSGYLLVHSQHTLHQRNQILQWLTLHKSLQPNQRIVQTQPFGPLNIVDVRSGVTNFHGLSNGVDRALLRKGDMHLRVGNYNEAERYYLACLNYHIMPEAILGLTLCNLYKGDARRAREWISQSIAHTMEIHKAVDPDAVEWAYFIIALLCQGDIGEAMRRAHQFPLLQHKELERCRWVIDTFNDLTVCNSERGHKDTSATARRSIHQMPQRDMANWVIELCKMLTACRQGGLAEQVHRRFCSDPTRSVAPSHRCKATRMAHLINLSRSKSVLPLIAKPFHVRIRQWIPARLRARMRSLLKRKHEFASATQAWAREEPASNALILGASDRSTYTHAFLDGIQQNPSMPTVFCIGSSTHHFKELERRFAKHHRIEFRSSSVDTVMKEAKVECFDIVLIDDYAPSEGETLESLRGTKTVLIRNVNTYPGYKVARSLLSDIEYRLAYEGMTRLVRSIVFTKRHRAPRSV
jgi:hypothetical protein